jgi:hypothetical protein
MRENEQRLGEALSLPLTKKRGDSRVLHLVSVTPDVEN